MSLEKQSFIELFNFNLSLKNNNFRSNFFEIETKLTSSLSLISFSLVLVGPRAQTGLFNFTKSTFNAILDENRIQLGVEVFQSSFAHSRQHNDITLVEENEAGLAVIQNCKVFIHVEEEGVGNSEKAREQFVSDKGRVDDLLCVYSRLMIFLSVVLI